jgi:arsenate reductase
MNNKPKILFICVHNSARSQMAEAFLNDICGAEFEAQSAGLEPGTLNPLVVEVMREVSFDLSKNKTQAVFDVFKSGQLFGYVITVCSEAEAGGCPIFPGPTQRLHWPFPDPSKVEGTHEEKLAKVRQVRNAIQARIEQFCAENCARLSESGRSLRQPQSSDRPR